MTQPTRACGSCVGAGRVGAVLAAALRAAGHEIVAAAGESDASRGRIDALLPGVAVAKPTDVARACDLLLLTVPDDMLPNVVAMLSASGAIREGQFVVHTSGRHGLAVLEPAARGRRPHHRAAPGDDLHRHRGRPAPARGLRLRRHRRRGRPRAHRGASSPTSAVAPCGSPRTAARSTTRASPTAPTTSSPWSPRRWRSSPPPAPSDPAATLRPLLTAALDNALDAGRRRPHRPDRARRRRDRPRPPRRPRRQRAADAPVVRRHGARHPRPRRHRRPAAADPRAPRCCGCSTPREVDAARRAQPTPAR